MTGCEPILIDFEGVLCTSWILMLVPFAILGKFSIIILSNRGTWVAQWVKASAFGSGHDPRVLGSSPTSGSLLSREPASLPRSACLSAYL